MSATGAPSLKKLTTFVGLTTLDRFRSRDVLSRELAARHPPSLSSSVAQLHGASAGSITDAEAVSLRAPSPERGASNGRGGRCRGKVGEPVTEASPVGLTTDRFRLTRTAPVGPAKQGASEPRRGHGFGPRRGAGLRDHAGAPSPVFVHESGRELLLPFRASAVHDLADDLGQALGVDVGQPRSTPFMIPSSTDDSTGLLP